MREHQPNVPIDRRVADGFHRRDALTFALRGVLIAVMVLAIGGVTFAYRAVATEPGRTTYTASATQLVVTYGAGADSIDVNVRYPDGTTTNYHLNRAAAVGEVLTLPLSGLPAWVQVHTTDCHLGEPGSPGYGTDCRLIEEDPWPTETTTPTPTPTTTPSVEPTTEPTSSPSPTTEPSPEPSDQPTDTPPSETPSTPDPTPPSPEPEPTTTSPAPWPDLDCPDGTVPGWLDDDGLPTSCVGDTAGNIPDPADPDPAVTSDVSAVDDTPRAATASPWALAATGSPAALVTVAALTLVAFGAVLIVARKERRR